MFNKKTILITGGTGSFGKQFINKILKDFAPKKIIIFSRDELKQSEMMTEKLIIKNDKIVRFFLGDIRDFERLKLAMNKVDIVVHTAALKQVPAAEYNPFEFVKTNILGSENVIKASLECNVDKVMALSTDKASSPINFYGATKLCSDKLFISANNYSGGKKTKFSVVRYGNVMGSRGSVIPLFLKQKSKSILNVTDKKMTRFNITLDEGVNFVIKCTNLMLGGELFVPKIPSYRIIDLAKSISPSAKIKIIGIRPGEKIHEEMISVNESTNAYEFKDFYVIIPQSIYAQKNYINNLNKKEKAKGKKCKNNFSYNSADNKFFLNINELKKLIDTNIH
jgi:UDP-N-acetylglucosamine 4,6-dehydratase/5-epimerase